MSRDLEIIHQEIINAWTTSEVAQRVTEVESIAYSHGYPQYTGPTIPDFLMAVLVQYTEALNNNPSLLGCVKADDPTLLEVRRIIDLVLGSEESKMNQINTLQKKVQSYWFGVLDPRWHLGKRRIKQLTNSLTLPHEIQ